MGSLKKWHRKKGTGKKAQGKNGTGKNGTKCMIGNNGTILFLLKTEINKFFKLYILLTKKWKRAAKKKQKVAL